MTQHRTLMVGTFFSSPGLRSACEDLAERLTRSGCAVVTTSGRTSKVARLVDMMATAWNLRDDYNVAQVDVFSGPAFFWAEAVCWVLRRARKPYVLTLHGGNLPKFATRYPRRVRRLLSSARAVTTPSTYLLDQMYSFRSDLRLISNGLDLEAYAFRPRRTLRPKLIWVRAFHDIYNPTLAAEVLAILAPEFPEIELVMLGRDKGDGSLGRFQRAAAQLGVEKHIRIAGAVQRSDVPAWLSNADIFLNTTNVDNAPVSVVEALACGLCVVSTDVGGIPYLLDHGRDALVVPPRDAGAMANAVRRLLQDVEMAAALSRGARRTARRFDWEFVIPQWQELLGSLTASRALSPLQH